MCCSTRVQTSSSHEQTLVPRQIRLPHVCNEDIFTTDQVMCSCQSVHKWNKTAIKIWANVLCFSNLFVCLSKP